MCDCHDLGDYEDLFRDEDILYRRVHEKHVVEGKVTPAHCLLVLPPQMSKRDIAKVRDKFLGVAVLRPTEPEPEQKWYLRAFEWIRSWFCS